MKRELDELSVPSFDLMPIGARAYHKARLLGGPKRSRQIYEFFGLDANEADVFKGSPLSVLPAGYATTDDNERTPLPDIMYRVASCPTAQTILIANDFSLDSRNVLLAPKIA